MKILLSYIFIIILSLNVVNAQKIHENELYKVVYSEMYQQPLLLEYSVPYGEPINKKEKSFKKSFNLINTSDHNDYLDTLYDKGHLAPVKAFESIQKDDALYYYLNCALMHRSLNRGAWSRLEQYELGLKNEKNEVNVSVSLIFDNNSFKVKYGATASTYFKKIIEVKELIKDDTTYINDYIQVSREVFIFPNNSRVKGKHYTEFKVDILSLNYKDPIQFKTMEPYKMDSFKYEVIEFKPIKLELMEPYKMDSFKYEVIEFKPIKLELMEPYKMDSFKYEVIEFKPIKLELKKLIIRKYRDDKF